MPFAVALLGPLLPLLIVFAGTLPSAAPHASKLLGWFIAGLMAISGGVSLSALLAAPLVALLATQLLAAVVGLNFTASAFSLACQAGGVICFAAAVATLGDAKTRRWFLACFLSSASAAALFAIALSLMREPPAMFAYEHGRASGTFLQPNEFAGYLLFVIPLGLAQTAAPRWLRVIGLMAAGIGILGLLLSVSRAAIVSLICAMYVFMRRLGRRAMLGYVALAALSITLMLLAFRDVAHDPSENASRLAVWAAALRLVERFALTGLGPLNFHLAYPALKLPQTLVDEVHAHSVPLQLLIENGILGLSAFIWLVFEAARACVRRARMKTAWRPEESFVFAAVTAGFAASGLQNLIDVVTTFLLILSWPMLGLIFAIADERTPLRAGP
jgi:O-antigen ligase